MGVPSHGGWAVVVLLVLAAACGAPERPHVVLVTFDTTRHDRFGCTGDPEARTPVVDGLAARGTLFEQAYSSVALTLPAHTTILAGIEPFAHGVHNNGRFRVPDGVDTLAEHLARAGYDTAAFVSAFVLDARFNLGQGFAVYRDDTHPTSGPVNFSVPTRPGAEVTDQALEWLAARTEGRPFFLWAHYYDPHLPRDIRAPFDALPDPYAAEIAYADAQLGRLLEGVEQAARDRSLLIVFTADHGESLGEHGESTHGLVAYDSTLHVPLVVVGRGFPPGARRRQLVRHIDIVPTVLDVAGLPVPESLPGRSLHDGAAEEEEDDDAVVGYFESRGPSYDLGWAVLEGVRTGRWKYTPAPLPAELYDVLADPREQKNLIAAAPDVRERMEALWRRALAARPATAPAQPEAPPPDVAERLAALGYVEAPRTAPAGAPPDPRRTVTAFGWVEGARNMAAAGRYGEAIETLETLRQSPSVRSLVLRSLAEVYAVHGRFEEAVRTYRAYIDLTGSDEARLRLARLYLQNEHPAEAIGALDGLPVPSLAGESLRAFALGHLGRHAEARAVLDAAFQMEGTQRARLRQRAALVLEVAPLVDGEQELRQLLAAAPGDLTLQSRLGYYLAVWGRAEQGAEAMAVLAAAGAAAAEDAELQGNLGWGAHERGDDEQAAPALERALTLDPGRDLDRLRLALVLRRRGELPRARELLRTALVRWPGARWAERARQTLRELDEDQGRS